jgi:Copper type II ascorbate-dependent monooxygenase, C-terminal domain
MCYRLLTINYLLLLFVVRSFAQTTLTYHQHIRPIIVKNCIECHKKGGIAPFSLEEYTDLAKRANFIADVTKDKYMPPFKADLSFQRYANERGLTDAEIDLIQKWAAQGAVAGSPPPTTNGEQLRMNSGQQSKTKNSNLSSGIKTPASKKPDLVLKMQTPFKVPDSGEEEFRYFHIPTHLTKDQWIETIEFVPGNRKVLHHSRVMIDTSGKMAAIEGIRADDNRLAEFQKIPMADQFLYGWVPGNDRVKFPTGVAKKIKAGSNLIMNLHYSASSRIEEDQSVVNLYFAKKPVKREIKSLILTEENISNKPFVIKANQKPTFYMSVGPIQESISAISILPHAHWLCQSFKAYCITPDGDLVPLIKIDHWDFNWQMTYQFQKLLHIPKGSVILAEATYDNTTENPLNPFKPARDVTYGWNSTAEMMELVIYYVPYQKGDEQVKQ